MASGARRKQKRIEPPKANEDGSPYHFTTDIADHAIRMMRASKAVAPQRPFFVYFSTGATHAPHQVPEEWIEKFKGKFDSGWDVYREETLKRQKEMGIIPANTKLTKRPDSLPAWDSLPESEWKVYARMMEVFAAFTAHTDHEVGRLLDAIDEMGEAENTIVMYIAGDNGSSAEGGLNGLLNEMTFFNAIPEPLEMKLKAIDTLGSDKHYNHFPAGWAHAMDTPFQWTKQIASHFGGTRNGMAISWPKKIKAKREIRDQFHHVIDIAPTLLEVIGIEAPTEFNGIAQKPIEGISMAYTFDDPSAKDRRTTQYFEMLGNQGIYHDGWMASAIRGVPWLSENEPGDLPNMPWELYNIEEDFSQANNLAKEHPEKLDELVKLFVAEAAKYNVLPLDDRKTERLNVDNRPSLTEGRTKFVYPNLLRLPERAAPDLKHKSHEITTDEFEQVVTDWITTARHPQKDKLYTEMVYQPMLELVAYLRTSGYKTYIVSGGGVEFMRPWTKRVYGIPPEQVVGSRGKLKFEVRDGTPVLVKLPEVDLIDDKEGKPVSIQQMIGRRPVMAFGNSDGDFEMLEWTTAGKGPRFGLIVHHTDTEREYAYDRESHVGKLDKALDKVDEKGWTVVDMKNDWKTVFPRAK